MIGSKTLMWHCDVCGAERADALVDVVRHDFSADFGFPAGTISRNVKHCKDHLPCVAGALDRERWRIIKRGSEVRS